MKKLHIALLSTAVLLIVSCKEEVEKPKVIYDAQEKSTQRSILHKCLF
jgi:hypothetical protein